MKIRNWILDPLIAISGLFYPKLCEVCGRVLIEDENVFCIECQLEFPRTQFHTKKDHDLEKLFWGRVYLESASAFFHYQKGSRYQHLLHDLKYKGRKDIGFELGRLYAYDLFKFNYHKNVDALIPIPLHPKKEKKRGYNQSEEIAKGLSKVLRIPIEAGLIERGIFTETQTNKSRIDRWENVQSIFKVDPLAEYIGKHLVIIDDVITTGSTIEAAALAIHESYSNAGNSIKISALSIGLA